jgi:uncharacterized membrane protein YgaE (UPF0421/DUF939 family)
MSEQAMWIVGGILTVLLTVIGFMISIGFNLLLKRIDKITDTLDAHNTDLIKVLSRNDIQSQFIDEHTEEIDNLKREIIKINLNCANNNHRKHQKE